jgi:hypothetical protein
MVQLNGAMDDLLLKRRKQAHAPRRRGNHLQLLRRVHRPLTVERRAKQPQHQPRRAVHQPHRWPRHADEGVHRPGNSQRNPFRPLQRQRLRHQLAQQQFKVSDRGKGNRNRQRVRIEQGVHWHHGKPVRTRIQQHLRHRRLADPAQGEARQRYAKLHGGQKFIDMALQMQRRARSRSAQRQQLLHARLAHADQRELRGHEEAVGQNEEGHHHRAKEHPFQHSVLSLALRPVILAASKENAQQRKGRRASLNANKIYASSFTTDLSMVSLGTKPTIWSVTCPPLKSSSEGMPLMP